MATITTLGFAGRTEEALEHYHDALDAETVFLMRFRDSPDQSHMKPGMEDMIFHATFRIDGTEFMASDVGYLDGEPAAVFAGFSLALRLKSLDHAKRVFDALADGGQTLIPLAKSAFTAWYGIVIDRFGVSWKISVDQDDR
ncbi:VOC family protein [Novipirellula artificiosorum]|nr:VOC family protein [Novipirellula artificiosorum]